MTPPQRENLHESYRASYTQVTRTGVRRIKPRNLSPTPFTFTKAFNGSVGKIEAYLADQKTLSYTIEGALIYRYARSTWYSYDRDDSNLQSSAEIKALLKLKNQTVNLGVAFAERARTATLVGDSALAIYKSVMAFRRGNFKEAFRRARLKYPRKWKTVNGRTASSKMITQQWLALQYGWTPLLNDIYGSCEALANREIIDYSVRVASRSNSKEVTYHSWYAIDSSFEGTKTSELSYHVALNYTPTETLIRRFSSLGLTNPLEIAWELVPFSFVVDWLVPVGSWLSSLDAANGWSFTSGTVTKRHVSVSKAVQVPEFYYGYGTKGDTILTNHLKVVNRQLYLTSPIPGRPAMKDPRSLKHMANAMALLVGLFSGGKLGKLSNL